MIERARRDRLFALPVGVAFGPRAYMAAFVTDRSSGFSEREIADLTAVSERLSIAADVNSQRQIAENVLKACLGPQTGRRVLAGQIRCGSGEIDRRRALVVGPPPLHADGLTIGLYSSRLSVAF